MRTECRTSISSEDGEMHSLGSGEAGSSRQPGEVAEGPEGAEKKNGTLTQTRCLELQSPRSV